MDELSEKIRASIENSSVEPWFPELTADLAARAWDNLHRDMGLTPDNYSTERVLSRSISAPREIIASLKSCPTSSISVEALTPKTLVKYRDQGANFYSPQELLDSTCLSCLEAALAIVSEVPSLMTTICTLVRSLHVINPENAEYDVSFSEPHVPFSIFVSVPERRIANDALRVAEAIVHEAMHLQLTLIDQITPLVHQTGKKYFSPWRQEYRNAQGLLHGVYVFGVITRFLEDLMPTDNFHFNHHAPQRRLEIAAEMNQVQPFQDSSALTCVGNILIRRVS